MDFFTNLWNKATNYLSSSAPSTPTSTPAPVQSSNYQTTPMTVAPNMSTNYGPARGNGNSVTYNTPYGAYNQPNIPNSTPAIPGVTASIIPTSTATGKPATAVRPVSTSTNSVTSSGYRPAMSSGPSAPVAPPPVATSGSQGTGGMSFAGNYTPANGVYSAMGQQGSSGVGRMSSIGSSPLGMTASAPGTTAEEQKSGKQFSFDIPQVPSAKTTWDAIRMSGALGDVTEKPLTASLPEGQINAKDVVSSSTPNLGSKTYQEQLAEINSKAQSIKQQLDTLNPTPTNPIKDTEAQTDFFNNLPEDQAFSARAFADQWRTQHGLTQLETSRIDMLKNLQAINETYKAAIDDIKADPNLPKQVAARRIQAVADAQKERVTALNNALELIGTEIKDLNSAMNTELNIREVDYQAANDRRKDAWDRFKFMAEAGAITDKAAWAKALGISEADISKAITGMGSGKVDKWLDLGDKYQAVDQFGNPIKSFSITKADSGGGVVEFASTWLKSNPTATPEALRLAIESNFSGKADSSLVSSIVAQFKSATPTFTPDEIKSIGDKLWETDARWYRTGTTDKAIILQNIRENTSMGEPDKQALIDYITKTY